MSFYMYNLVELVSLPYSYFLRLVTSTGLSSKEAFEFFLRLQPTDVYKKLKKLVPRTVVSKERKELLAGTDEGKMCTVKYTVCQTWLSVCMCSCFYVIGVGYKPMCELSEHSFER